MSRKPSDYINWYEYAKNDLKAANIMLKEKLYNQVCFHSQQCVEKLLKAVLHKENIDVPRVHSIVELVRKSENILDGINAFRLKAAILDSYYIPTRYPDAIVGSLEDGLPDEEDAREALEIANLIESILIVAEEN
jgi:HEPN domain-containing protein